MNRQTDEQHQETSAADVTGDNDRNEQPADQPSAGETGDGAAIGTGEENAQILQEKLQETARELAQARAELKRSETLRRVDACLLRAGVIDLETARLLVEKQAGADADAEQIVADLRTRKPFLFHRVAGQGGTAMGARAGARKDPAAEAARSALDTGRRSDVLHYLRLRRQNGRQNN